MYFRSGRYSNRRTNKNSGISGNIDVNTNVAFNRISFVIIEFALYVEEFWVLVLIDLKPNVYNSILD